MSSQKRPPEHGEGLVSHAGSALLSQVTDKTGLTKALSRGLAGMCERRGGHDPGRVVRDLAVMLAGGGEVLSDLGAAPQAGRVTLGAPRCQPIRRNPQSVRAGGEMLLVPTGSRTESEGQVTVSTLRGIRKANGLRHGRPESDSLAPVVSSNSMWQEGGARTRGLRWVLGK